MRANTHLLSFMLASRHRFPFYASFIRVGGLTDLPEVPSNNNKKATTKLTWLTSELFHQARYMHFRFIFHENLIISFTTLAPTAKRLFSFSLVQHTSNLVVTSITPVSIPRYLSLVPMMINEMCQSPPNGKKKLKKIMCKLSGQASWCCCWWWWWW